MSQQNHTRPTTLFDPAPVSEHPNLAMFSVRACTNAQIPCQAAHEMSQTIRRISSETEPQVDTSHLSEAIFRQSSPEWHSTSRCLHVAILALTLNVLHFRMTASLAFNGSGQFELSLPNSLENLCFCEFVRSAWNLLSSPFRGVFMSTIWLVCIDLKKYRCFFAVVDFSRTSQT